MFLFVLIATPICLFLVSKVPIFKEVAGGILSCVFFFGYMGILVYYILFDPKDSGSFIDDIRNRNRRNRS